MHEGCTENDQIKIGFSESLNLSGPLKIYVKILSTDQKNYCLCYLVYCAHLSSLNEIAPELLNHFNGERVGVMEAASFGLAPESNCETR